MLTPDAALLVFSYVEKIGVFWRKCRQSVLAQMPLKAIDHKCRSKRQLARQMPAPNARCRDYKCKSKRQSENLTKPYILAKVLKNQNIFSLHTIRCTQTEK
jgi:hypothetical protein